MFSNSTIFRRARPFGWARLFLLLAPVLIPAAAVLGQEGPKALPEGLLRVKDTSDFRWEKDGATMVFVGGGQFVRGKNGGSETDEGPASQVEVGGFFMDKYEVTNGRYREFYAWWKGAPKEERKKFSHPDEPLNHDHRPAYWPAEEKEGETSEEEGADASRDEVPVVGISWFSAYSYARWAGKDLPTECEWEKAASGGYPGVAKREWPWGDETPDFTKCNFAGNVGRPVRGGSYAEGLSPAGTHDMAGNVWEWCLDYYHEDFYKTEASKRADPKNLFPSAYRVVRGGSYISRIEEVRTTFRDRARPSKRYPDVGFRCVIRMK